MAKTIYPRARVKDRELHIALLRNRMDIGDLAERLDVSRATVSSVANGRECSLTMAERIVKAIGVALADVFDVIDAPAGSAT